MPGAAGSVAALYPVLSGLSAPARALFDAQVQALQLPAGATVFDEQQQCRGFPFVLRGAIRVVKSAANGRELPLYRVTPGETCVITSGCLLGHSAYNARGITEGPTEVLLLPPAAFETLLAEPAFRSFVFGLFADRLAELMQLIEAVAFQRLDQRLAALLLGHGATVRSTHQQLANELGSVREIVSRLLKGFAAQGLVALGREQIEILDAAALRRLAEGAR